MKNTNAKMKETVTIDILSGVVYGYYTRYPELKPITYNAFTRTRASKLNIYIDLDDIFMRIDKRMANSVINGAEIAITSSIINMCAHYRNFFINTYGVATDFFLIGNSTNEYAEDKICPEYDHPKPSQISTVALKDRIMTSILPALVPYIPDISLLNAPYDFNTNALCIHMVKGNTDPEMAISKDPYSFILGGFGFYILRPKKYKGDDTSFIVLPEDAALSYFCSQSKALNPDTTAFKYLNTLPLVVATTGCISRKLRSINRAIIMKIKQCVLDDKAVVNMPNLQPGDIEIFLDRYCNCDSNTIYRIMDRLKAINCYSLSENMYLTGEFNNKFSSVNLYDPEKVKKLNETIFAPYPLDLNVL